MIDVNWIPVYGSKNVEAIRYDEAARKCYVKFHSGGEYVYKDVTPELWNEFYHADSKGRFVNRVLKRGYESEKLKEYDKIRSESSGSGELQSTSE